MNSMESLIPWPEEEEQKEEGQEMRCVDTSRAGCIAAFSNLFDHWDHRLHINKTAPSSPAVEMEESEDSSISSSSHIIESSKNNVVKLHELLHLQQEPFVLQDLLRSRRRSSHFYSNPLPTSSSSSSSSLSSSSTIYSSASSTISSSSPSATASSSASSCSLSSSSLSSFSSLSSASSRSLSSSYSLSSSLSSSNSLSSASSRSLSSSPSSSTIATSSSTATTASSTHDYASPRRAGNIAPSLPAPPPNFLPTLGSLILLVENASSSHGLRRRRKKKKNNGEALSNRIGFTSPLQDISLRAAINRDAEAARETSPGGASVNGNESLLSQEKGGLSIFYDISLRAAINQNTKLAKETSLERQASINSKGRCIDDCRSESLPSPSKRGLSILSDISLQAASNQDAKPAKEISLVRRASIDSNGRFIDDCKIKSPSSREKGGLSIFSDITFQSATDRDAKLAKETSPGRASIDSNGCFIDDFRNESPSSQEKGGLSIFYERLMGSFRERPMNQSMENGKCTREASRKWRKVSPLKLFSRKKSTSNRCLMPVNEPLVECDRSFFSGQKESKLVNTLRGEVAECGDSKALPTIVETDSNRPIALTRKLSELDRIRSRRLPTVMENEPLIECETSDNLFAELLRSDLATNSVTEIHRVAEVTDRMFNHCHESASISEPACNIGVESSFKNVAIDDTTIASHLPKQNSMNLRLCNFSWWEEHDKLHQQETSVGDGLLSMCHETAWDKWVSSPQQVRKVFEEVEEEERDRKSDGKPHCVKEEEANPQFSPVSVLDDPFEEDSSTIAMENFLASFEVAKQHLLEKVQHYELMGRLDWSMLQKYTDEEETSLSGISEYSDESDSNLSIEDGDEISPSFLESTESASYRHFVDMYKRMRRRRHNCRQNRKVLYGNADGLIPCRNSVAEIVTSKELMKEIRKPIFTRVLSELIGPLLAKDANIFSGKLREVRAEIEEVVIELESTLSWFLLEELLLELTQDFIIRNGKSLLCNSA